jgi:large subunit ribosomal protein L19
MNLIDEVAQSEKKRLAGDGKGPKRPELRVGMTVRVGVRIAEEGKKERVQEYEGDIVGMRGKGIGRTVTVRKISYGVGVERNFPLHSPVIAHIKVVKSGRVRRAKLYYLRKRVGKATQIREVGREEAQKKPGAEEN